MNSELIAAKEAEFQALAFQWAKELGFTGASEHIKVTLKIKASTCTDQLTELDWELIFALKKWRPRDLKILNSLKESGNKWTPFSEFKEASDRYAVPGSVLNLHSKFSAHKPKTPYYISLGSNHLQIRKRTHLMPK